jgi:hypothetical protein
MDKKIRLTQIPTFYINLDGETDRKRSMKQMLTNLGFENFERFPGIRADKRVGCSTSHAAVLQKIIDENIFPAIVLEDDSAVFNFRKIVECPEDADALYLGISRMGWTDDSLDPFGKSLKVSEMNSDYHRVHNMLARHSIIHFSKDFAERSIEEMHKFTSDPNKYLAGDVVLTSILPQYKIYALNSPIFYQDDAGTRGLTKKSIYDCSYVEVDKT